MSLQIAGTAMVPLPQRALYLPAHDLLLVADAHIGKAQSFRRLGVPVPGGTTAGTLARLDAALAACGVRHIVFLGDLLHARRGRNPATEATVARWRDGHPELTLTLVRGNHDHHAGDPPAAWGVHCVDGPLMLPAAVLADPAAPTAPTAPTAPIAPIASIAPTAPTTATDILPLGLALSHHPEPLPGAYVLAGHIHPAVRLGGRAHDSLRLPCFHFGPAVGVLPAFGEFTGMHVLSRGPQDRVFVVAGEAVRELR